MSDLLPWVMFFLTLFFGMLLYWMPVAAIVSAVLVFTHRHQKESKAYRLLKSLFVCSLVGSFVLFSVLLFGS